MKTKLYLIGGFLGAGKTTFLSALAERSLDSGERIGLITNDQAAGLVDTQYLKKDGVPVEEVSGSCFCCNFPGFLQAVEHLQKHADRIFAEAVGSCTDLTATIIQPLEDKYPETIQVMPFTVLADPERLTALLNGEATGLAADAEYILQKQMEEADYILINKADTLTGQQRTKLKNLVEEKFPQAEVRCISALTEEGINGWLQELEKSTLVPGMHPADVDYDRYADGESALGWLNMTFGITADEVHPDWEQLTERLLRGLSACFSQESAAVGHVWEKYR